MKDTHEAHSSLKNLYEFQRADPSFRCILEGYSVYIVLIIVGPGTPVLSVT